MSTLGVLGGSGLYEIPGLKVRKRHIVETPYGAPSDAIIEAEVEHLASPGDETHSRIFFLPRHGVGHRLAPHQINYRANICALKKLGVQQLVSMSAVGSMKEHIAPGDVVLVDQYIDMTKARSNTFFDNGIVAHVSLADPACDQLASAVECAAQEVRRQLQRSITIHNGGTYLCMEGPQFSSRAESRMYRSWGVSVIGMTGATEAKLAREAELPYLTIALATDYDCWHMSEDAVSVQAVVEVLKQNVQLSQALILALPAALPNPRSSRATGALKHALISHAPHSHETRQRLSWLLPELDEQQL